MRRRRLVRGIASRPCWPSATGIGRSRRSRSPTSSRCATGRGVVAVRADRRRREPPTVRRADGDRADAPGSASTSTARVDGRSIGHDRARRRARPVRRPLARLRRDRAASSGCTARPRSATDAWIRQPFSRLAPGDARPRSATPDLDLTGVPRGALSPEARAAAEARGVGVIEGARARQCRIAVDGPTFRAAFPQVALAGRRRRPRPTGAASSTTGSSSTARSAGSRAASTATRPRSSPAPSRRRSGST